MHISEAKNVHLVGIKGVAMTALALCLQDMGARVKGSDVAEEFVTDDILEKRHIPIETGFSSGHISQALDLVVYTGAHQGKNNVEVQRARDLGIHAISHAEALGELTSKKKLISVCGTGGKSTTSAMIAWILYKMGMNPSFAVGVGNIPNFNVPGRYVADSEWFVAEADEYAVDPTDDHRPRFTFQNPEVIVCTNLAYDHPDIYPSFESMITAFSTFFKRAKENVYINADSPTLKKLFDVLRDKEEIGYESCSVGLGNDSDYKISNITLTGKKQEFTITYRGVSERQPFLFQELEWKGKLSLPGEYNVRNAALAWLAVVDNIDVDRQKALDTLQSFKGTMRRFEYKGTVNGAPWYDDYAHTPDEIKVTLKALREWFPDKKIVAVFQPHTYSRTRSLFNEFSRSFTDADMVILIDIFASARESFDPNVSSDTLENAIRETRDVSFVKNMKNKEEVVKYLVAHTDSSMVVMTLGAGDVYTIYTMIKNI